MDDHARFVDPFLGNGEMDLPRPEGIAATWFFIKAQSGNTHPGATLPLGMVSACAYTGGYPTGYGVNTPNYHSRVRRISDRPRVLGFTHFHHSGTGAAGRYYNYLRVSPYRGALATIDEPCEISDEAASPGAYRVRLPGRGVLVELAVSASGALHRYTFEGPAPAGIALDFTAGGLPFPKMGSRPQEAAVRVIGDREALGFFTMHGLTFHVSVLLSRAPAGARVWMDHQPLEGTTASARGPEEHRVGCVFEIPPGGGAWDLRIGFSLRGEAGARQNARELAGASLEDLERRARDSWNAHLGRIEVDARNDRERRIFATALYHSLLKPARFGAENPLWKGGELYLDFVTLWDIYKTELPLLFTVYPERGREMVDSLVRMGEHLGYFPVNIMTCTEFGHETQQARALAEIVIMDAYHRRLAGIDWRRALEVMLRDLGREDYRDFVEGGRAERATHTLDMAEACAAVATLARDLGEQAEAKRLERLAANWIHAYDAGTGLLRADSVYYEGGRWNYSFRLQHNMRERIGLYPREADFVRDLDRFFGYGAPRVSQPQDPDDSSYVEWGKSLDRFEGLNNEPDMETPYAYLYAGRPDRTVEVLRAGMRFMFTDGPGGLPGNDDSGGLSSWFVWNALGIFPVAGQPVMLIGSPSFEEARIELPGGPLVIRAPGASERNIYVQGARLDGRELDRAWLSVDELLRGRTLELAMGARPSAWATQTRPPG